MSKIDIYKFGKLPTVMAFRESNDIIIINNPPVVKTAKNWNAKIETDGVLSSLKCRNMVGAVQITRRELGFGIDRVRPILDMLRSERRCFVSNVIEIIESEN